MNEENDVIHQDDRKYLTLCAACGEEAELRAFSIKTNSTTRHIWPLCQTCSQIVAQEITDAWTTDLRKEVALFQEALLTLGREGISYTPQLLRVFREVFEITKDEMNIITFNMENQVLETLQGNPRFEKVYTRIKMNQLRAQQEKEQREND